MELIKCPKCDKEISPAIKKCIHCGHPLKPFKINTPLFISYLFSISAIGLVLIQVNAKVEWSFDTYMGITASLMGACATFIVGFQILNWIQTKNLYEEIKNRQNYLDSQLNRLVELEKHVEKVTPQIVKFNTDMLQVQTEIGDFKAHVTGVTTQIEQFNKDMEEIRTDIENFKTTSEKATLQIEASLVKYNKDIAEFKKHKQEVIPNLEKINKSIQILEPLKVEIKDQTSLTYSLIFFLEGKIFVLRNMILASYRNSLLSLECALLPTNPHNLYPITYFIRDCQNSLIKDIDLKNAV